MAGQSSEPTGAKRSPKGSSPVVQWLANPEHDDYSAARSYLSLNAKSKTTKNALKKLAHTKRVHFKAKDLLRASNLPLLPRNNPDVAKELARVASGEPLSPCLVIRGRLEKGRVAQIADGYHRICAAYHVNGDTDIPVQIIRL